MIRILWLIPAIPVLAAGFIALLKQGQRKLAATAAIGALGVSLVLSVMAFVSMLSHSGRQVENFHWLQFGTQWVSLGWLLDPLAAIMLVMVSFVGLLIFIYSIGYMAEDEFAYASGLYRDSPPNNPIKDKRVADGGRLQILGVVPAGASGPVAMDLHADQNPGSTYRVAWIDIEDPDPDFAPGLSNDEAARIVFQEGESKGAARFARNEGMAYWGGKVFFVSTEGGGPFVSDPPPNSSAGVGDGYGQVWMYDTNAETLTLLFESPGPDVLDFPDNVTTSPRGTLVVCEDNVNDNYLRGLTRGGQLFDIALNRLVSSTGVDRSNDEFAGSTFSPDGHTLYVNIQASAGLTFAIWGPWGRIGV